MLTPPDLPTDTIIAYLRETYKLPISRVTFLPIGADVNAAVYRADATDGAAYFLKLKRSSFDEIAVAVPAYLHAQGILPVMAPLRTAAGQLSERAHDFVWILYPFFDGHNGFQVPLTGAQWTTLGRTMRAVHTTSLPPALERQVPHEDFSPRLRNVATAYLLRAETGTYDDPIAARFAAFWRSQQADIRAIIERAGLLAATLLSRPTNEFVLCHSDLHPGNLLVGANDALAIVDWDEPIIAPRERDLMFPNMGIDSRQDSPHTEAMFYQGYGPVAVDLHALAYYRYERIVADLAAFGDQIFGVEGSVEDREWGLHKFMEAFLPRDVVDVAHQTYAQLG